MIFSIDRVLDRRPVSSLRGMSLRWRMYAHRGMCNAFEVAVALREAPAAPAACFRGGRRSSMHTCQGWVSTLVTLQGLTPNLA